MKNKKVKAPKVKKARSLEEWKQIENERLISEFVRVFSEFGGRDTQFKARVIKSEEQENCLEVQTGYKFNEKLEFYTQFWIVEYEEEEGEKTPVWIRHRKRKKFSVTTGHTTPGTRDEPPDFVEVELGDFYTLSEALYQCLEITLKDRWNSICENLSYDIMAEQEEETEARLKEEGVL